MKFICLGYGSGDSCHTGSEVDMSELMEACCAYDDKLRANGNFVASEALFGPESAKSVRWKDGEPVVTDGPFIETKEQVGGFQIIEANDIDHALEIMLAHPGVRGSAGLEIRPIFDTSAMVEASREARGNA
ncbi:MAG: hypothetical protein KF784_00880 [Fimbriimonadaceae bacterium]|nr:hypothetical protein [Fimbriimonadaceae bacterium]